MGCVFPLDVCKVSQVTLEIHSDLWRTQTPLLTELDAKITTDSSAESYLVRVRERPRYAGATMGRNEQRQVKNKAKHRAVLSCLLWWPELMWKPPNVCICGVLSRSDISVANYYCGKDMSGVCRRGQHWSRRHLQNLRPLLHAGLVKSKNRPREMAQVQVWRGS